jgi:2-polyprenyl-3-methyl-5-hydroxy-6-metoxy-1,4-benzoquinol methylase
MDIVVDPIDHAPAQYLFTAKDNRGKPGAFSYYRAENGLVFIDRIPDDLGAYYEGGFDPIPNDESGLADAARGDEHKLEPIRRVRPTGRYLEIGPWIGKAAYNARQAGYDVTVLEQDERCVALLSSIGLRALRTLDPAEDLEAMLERGERFDAIAMWHSIEHLPRPWTVVERLAELLNPGGVLLIAAPNPDSAQFRHYGGRWYHLDAPRHLYLLPIALLDAITARKGLRRLEATTDDERGVLEDDYAWRWQARQSLLRFPILRYFAPRWLGPWLKRRHRRPGTLDGATYTLLFEKPAQP